jgi:hypothetical protein
MCFIALLNRKSLASWIARQDNNPLDEERLLTTIVSCATSTLTDPTFNMTCMVPKVMIQQLALDCAT